MRSIARLLWAGLWTGFGFECSFFVLWAGWKLVHRAHAHKFESTHFFHDISEYFK